MDAEKLFAEVPFGIEVADRLRRHDRDERRCVMSLRETDPEFRRARFESLAEAEAVRRRMERALGVELPPSKQEVELKEQEAAGERQSA